MRIIVTGSAGFIGMHTVKALAPHSDAILGVDNLNDYYQVELKTHRQAALSNIKNYQFAKIDMVDQENLNDLIDRFKPTHIIHLAAQAGVRFSIENPRAYMESNLIGHYNILEAARRATHQGSFQHLIYASSSSVYGESSRTPFEELAQTDQPESFYAATKKSNELMAHSFSHIYDIQMTGLRFFTVYGPWGRPDMAPWKFTQRILAGQPIDIYNQGNMRRDFSFIDDIVEGIRRIATQNQLEQRKAENSLHRVYNIGAGQPIDLIAFIKTLEKEIGLDAQKNFMPMQPGDVTTTYADTSALERDYGFRPHIGIEQGIRDWVAWYRRYTNSPS